MEFPVLTGLQNDFMKMNGSRQPSNIKFSKDQPPPELEWVNKMARLMDSQFRVPGTKFRFGLDPILGLIPVAGDLASYGISAVLVMAMARYGASGKVMVMMIGNVLLDAIIGSIPILGAIFDFAYKANNRNINLLQKHYHEGKYQGSGKGIIIGVALVFLAFLILIIYGSWKLLEYLYDLIIV
jgi:hypothetical protein